MSAYSQGAGKASSQGPVRAPQMSPVGPYLLIFTSALLGLSPKLASSTETELYETVAQNQFPQPLSRGNRSLLSRVSVRSQSCARQKSPKDLKESNRPSLLQKVQSPSQAELQRPLTSISRLQWASGPTPILAQMKLNFTCTWAAQGLGGGQGGVACPL